MRAYLIVGNPGSGKSTLTAELSRRGLIAPDADDLAFWEDSAGLQVIQPADADDAWRFAHRWVWSRTRNLQVATAASGDASSTFFCGIARNQAEILDLFDEVLSNFVVADHRDLRLSPVVSLICRCACLIDLSFSSGEPGSGALSRR